MDSWGLTRQTAFQCAWKFLFHARPEVISRNLNVSHQFGAPTVMKIGIQIRFGDAEFAKLQSNSAHAAALKRARPWFDCAQQIEAHSAGARPVLWYLISDSINLRRAAQLQYGSKIATDIETAPSHVDCSSNNPMLVAAGSCQGEQMQTQAMQTAAADILAFAMTDVQVMASSIWLQTLTGQVCGFPCSNFVLLCIISRNLCDLQVITRESGFGRIGGLLSGRKQAIWQVRQNPLNDSLRDCSTTPDTLAQLASAWSGI